MDIIAPHHCYGCGEIGTTLCQNCKYDIVFEAFSGCIVCASPASVGICSSCRSTYEKAWCVGERSGALETLIDAYKFERVKSADAMLASLLDEVVDVFPANTVVLPVPTLPGHIRKRGYDHARLLAKAFASTRRLSFEHSLRRKTTSAQRGASRKERMKQAEDAFECRGILDADRPYLLIDDVVTTNATLRYSAEALRSAGAKTVWVAVIARQPLDKSV
jgi:ComF family protein